MNWFISYKDWTVISFICSKNSIISQGESFIFTKSTEENGLPSVYIFYHNINHISASVMPEINSGIRFIYENTNFLLVYFVFYSNGIKLWLHLDIMQ